MSTAGPSRPIMDVRHHPYARPKWHTYNDQPNGYHSPSPRDVSREKYEASRTNQHSNVNSHPPSPPRSRRDPSETPSLGLGVAFGGSAGGKWWDEELPPPPVSLSSILDSFRRSGEGDRDLLLSILGAKKAEEERLTALIQTRLTILQARLSLHSAAASLAAASPPPGGLPLQVTDSKDSNSSEKLQAPIIGVTKPSPSPESNERTPSLSESRESHSSANSPTFVDPSPSVFIPPGPVSASASSPRKVYDEPKALPQSQSQGGYHHRLLSPPVPVSVSIPQHPPQFNNKERSEGDRKLPPLWVGREPVKGYNDERMVSPKSQSQQPERKERERSNSGGSAGERERNGLDMLLDAGMRSE